MTSITRSTRRADGHYPIHHLPAGATHTRSQNILQHAATRNSKRPYEHSDRDFDAFKSKKARITVEILSKQQFQARNSSSEHVNSRHNPPPPPPARQVATKPVPPKPVSAPPAAAAPIAPPPAAAPNTQPSLTKHQEKVINGIKHELNRLQPNAADTKEQGRKLRSQEATRFKSELSAYFPDYDEVIGNDPREQHILNLDTPIIVVDAPTSSAVPHISSAPERSRQPHLRPEQQIRSYSDALFFKDLYEAQKIDFGFLEARYKGKSLDDPLPDSYFEPSHKKAERLERSIRNSEKGRAQHEKDQIIRLLEGLQGPDWLRTMGVSGITESRKKTFEPARAHFIKGCQAILEKFRRWNIEEKRRKLEKERALAEEARAEEEDEASAEEEEEEEVEEESESQASEEEAGEEVEEEEEEEGGEEEEKSAIDQEEQDDDVEMADDDGGGNESDGDPPDYSDADASIAKQLREEAMARSRYDAKAAAKEVLRPPSPEPYKEFTSFFEKRWQRDAALNKNRRRGRTVLAWGQPVPEPPEVEFYLPEEYRDEETLKTHARRRRRVQRSQKH
ncbi:putative iq calmodulin-binding domain-containing protein [Phaeoacremonium minimum UCRPA7]|uniref:Putative iq calmodulin-binding domain-containing protein n=1 Tax=Phaeoacremonium minimum (strain UCR-PA7) TaxID=1286976 RepID=R8BN12_PHAM7|nr:putative iq calmodulin-binding domain-containing protein [Phaeoacremonium minimum UCRPA7]EOO00675.1 putative iq calmodulin-binding domain-containing protein [Phaeoacremonium minimum UCRPA7]